MWLFRKPDKRAFLSWRGYLSGIGLVALITWLLLILPSLIIPRPIPVPYMLAIVPVAAYFGLGPAIVTSVLSVFAYDYFILLPQYIFSFPETENLGILLVFLFVGIVVSFLASNLRHRIEETRRLSSALIKSQEEERKRIARELHDDTSPSLALVGFELDNLRKKYPALPEEAARELKTIREKIDRTQQDIRHYSHELHPAMLDNLGLALALEALIDEINTKRSARIEFNVEGTERSTSDEVKLELYRITQEALTNAWKHSRATEISVNLEYTPSRIVLSIVDNGIGFDDLVKTRSLGISNMKERAGLIGAKLRIESQINKGTKVSVEVSN